MRSWRGKNKIEAGSNYFFYFTDLLLWQAMRSASPLQERNGSPGPARAQGVVDAAFNILVNAVEFGRKTFVPPRLASLLRLFSSAIQHGFQRLYKHIFRISFHQSPP